MNSSPRDKGCLRETWQHIKNKNIVWLFLLNNQAKDFINCLLARKCSYIHIRVEGKMESEEVLVSSGCSNKPPLA